MLRMSKLADYGTVIMAELARDPARLMSAAALAGGTGLGAPTVSKVLKRLARADLVIASRGKQGGYALSRTPSEISVADIIDAVDGPFGLTECAAVPGACAQEGVCCVRPHWRRVSRAVRGALAAITLAEMTEPRARALRFVPRPLAQGGSG
jgi:FeS assembly SUF system regulator